jgi:hypothetical protein
MNILTKPVRFAALALSMVMTATMLLGIDELAGFNAPGAQAWAQQRAPKTPG